VFIMLFLWPSYRTPFLELLSHVESVISTEILQGSARNNISSCFWKPLHRCLGRRFSSGSFGLLPLIHGCTHPQTRAHFVLLLITRVTHVGLPLMPVFWHLPNMIHISPLTSNDRATLTNTNFIRRSFNC
jgi:hypothetical protein